MALTYTSAWLAAMRGAKADLRTLVTIYDGTTTWKAVSGSMASTSDLAGTAVAVKDVATVGVEIDPVSREVDSGELFVDFDNAWLGPIVVANRLKGQEINCFIGAKSLNEADFLPCFSGPIERIQYKADGTITVQVSDLLEKANTAKIAAAYIRKHPLEMLYAGDGSGVLERLGFLDFNTDSFDPSHADYATISHIVVSLGGAVGTAAAAVAAEARSGEDLVSQASSLIGGSVIIDEKGDAKFVRCNASAASARSWTSSDILMDSFEQETADNLVVNRIVFTFGWNKYTFRVDDTPSQAAYAHPGASERIYSRDFNIVALQAKGSLYSGGSIGAADVAPDVDLNPANPEGFSGNRSEAWAAISATRPAYLWLDSSHTSGGIEIIKAEGLSKFGTRTISYRDPETKTETHITDVPRRLTYTSTTREQFGTAAADHYEPGSTYATIVCDATAPALLSDHLLRRFRFGSIVVRFKTPLSDAWVQAGDITDLTYSRFVDYGKNGLTAEKMEVVGKQLTLSGDEPCCEWTLASVGETATTRSGRAIEGSDSFRAFSLFQNATEQNTTQPYINSGYAVVRTGVLTASIGAGIVTNGEISAGMIDDDSHLFIASKDTYISVDVLGGSINYYDVPNSDPIPSKTLSEAWIGKVVTDAVDITAIDTTTLRETVPHLGSKIKNLTITEAQIGPLAVTTPKLNDLAVVAGKIGELAVTEGKIGTLAVTSGKIGTGAVIEAKLGALAVTSGKIGTGAVIEAKLGALAVTSGKIGANAVIAGKLADGAVDTAGRLATGVVTAPKVADQVIDDQHVFQERTVAVNPNPNFLRYR